MATKSLNEKWLSIVQLTGEKGENEIGGFSTITLLVLSLPINKIPFHVLHLPVAQQESLLPHALTHPHLSRAFAKSNVTQRDPILTQLLLLYHSYIIV